MSSPSHTLSPSNNNIFSACEKVQSWPPLLNQASSETLVSYPHNPPKSLHQDPHLQQFYDSDTYYTTPHEYMDMHHPIPSHPYPNSSTSTPQDPFTQDAFHNAVVGEYASSNTFPSQEHVEAIPDLRHVREMPGFHFAASAGPYPHSTSHTHPHPFSHSNPHSTPKPLDAQTKAFSEKQLRRNRNKLSASRCRSKRKEWISGMEMQYEGLSNIVEATRQRVCMLMEANAYQNMVYFAMMKEVYVKGSCDRKTLEPGEEVDECNEDVGECKKE